MCNHCMKIDKRFNFRRHQQGIVHRKEYLLMRISVQFNGNNKLLRG